MNWNELKKFCLTVNDCRLLKSSNSEDLLVVGWLTGGVGDEPRKDSTRYLRINEEIEKETNERLTV